MWVGFLAQNHENIVCELLKISAAFCHCRQVVKICKEKIMWQVVAICVRTSCSRWYGIGAWL